jgi:hypothetical protein
LSDWYEKQDANIFNVLPCLSRQSTRNLNDNTVNTSNVSTPVMTLLEGAEEARRKGKAIFFMV